MARKSKTVKRRSYRRSRRAVHRSHGGIGLIPALLGGGAAAYPFLANTNGQPNVVQRVMDGDIGGAGVQFMGTITNPQALYDMAVLGALAAGFAFVGKKLGSADPHVTKKMKVF